MKLLIKKWMVNICLATISCQAFSQMGFRELRGAAWDSSNIGKHTAALTLLHKAEALKGIDIAYNPSVYIDLGDTHKEIGNIDSCTFYYEEANKYVQYFEKEKDSNTLSILYNRIGIIELHYLGNFNQAVQNFKKELLYERPQKDSTSVPDCLSQIGTAYKYLENFDSALHYFNLSISSPYANGYIKFKSFRLIADVYSLNEHYGNALTYYNLAIQGLVLLKDSLELFNAFNNKGDYLYKQKKFAESLLCFIQAEKFLTKKVTYNQLSRLYYNIAEVYNINKDGLKAFQYKKMEVGIKDSLNIQDIKKVAAEKKAEFKSQEDSIKLRISNQDRKIANDRFYGTLIGAIVICLIAFLSLRNALLRKRANKKLSAQKAKVEALADKLEEANQTKARLFSVISHDLRSPVSSLYASLKMQELKDGNGEAKDAVSSHIMHLLDTLEDLLTWSKSQMDRFTLQPVILRIMDLYADLIELHQDAAAAKQITIVNNANRQVKIYTDENLLKTILRNVLANSIHHAPNKSTVTADAVVYENGIVCTISNEATATDAALLQAKLQTANIGSSKHGLGNVLIKEFTEKLNAGFEVMYADGKVYLQIKVPALHTSVKALKTVL